MADQEFNFEAEFSLLDIGATSSMIRTGGVRPTILAFTTTAGVEPVTLDWTDEAGRARAFEEARRFVRDLQPAAYAFITHLSRDRQRIHYCLPGEEGAPGQEYLAVAMYSNQSQARGVVYPVKRQTGRVSFGMPEVEDIDTIDWCPLGDVWANPFCEGDTVRFQQRDRAVDPSSSLWTAIVELTRMRIHEDQPNSEEYMSFLDDLRNGVFVVAGRADGARTRVLLRPRTNFNPLGTLNIEASRLRLSDAVPADVEKVATS